MHASTISAYTMAKGLIWNAFTPSKALKPARVGTVGTVVYTNNGGTVVYTCNGGTVVYTCNGRRHHERSPTVLAVAPIDVFPHRFVLKKALEALDIWPSVVPAYVCVCVYVFVFVCIYI